MVIMWIVWFCVETAHAEDEFLPQPIYEYGVDTTEKLIDKYPPQPSATYYGKCRITAYCSCVECCGKWALNRPKDENGKDIVNGSSGQRLVSEYSVAASLPYGTILEIDGLDSQFEVMDRTADWIQDKYSGMVIDIYIDDHQKCYDYLSHMPAYSDVYIVSELT